MSTTLDDIIGRAHDLSAARNRLGQMVQALNAALEALKANELPSIREQIDIATAAWQGLEAEIRANPHLFAKPRTQAAHGITFGIQRDKPSLLIPDPERTVKLLRRYLPDTQAVAVIKVVETPVKKAIEQLPADMLKRVGVEIKAGVDRVVIRPAEGQVDKLVRALISAQADEARPDDSGD
jgi:hypothetical protein